MTGVNDTYMGDDMTNSHEPILPTSHSQYDQFLREIEERLHDGCSLRFTVPHHIATTLAHDVFETAGSKRMLYG